MELNTLYDEKCYELACHFIDDSNISHDTTLKDLHCRTLAQVIQIAVESYFDANSLDNNPPAK